MVNAITIVAIGEEKLVIPGTSPSPFGGPWLLNEDGTYILDEDGNRIPLE